MRKMEGLENTILIIHQFDLLNGAADLKPAAIFAAHSQPHQQTDPNWKPKTRAYNPHDDDMKAGKKCQGKNIIIQRYP